ncbi:MAG: hypothetical protein ABFD89_06835 [Bryobacteraceae bacterium]
MPPELETPVQTPELVRAGLANEDNRPAEVKANTSHLQGLILPGAAEAEAEEYGAVAEHVEGVKLPRTLKDTLALLAEVQGHQPKDRAEEKVKALMLEKVSAHLHVISQGPTCKPISTSGHAALASASSDHADEIHLTLLCRSDRVVADRLAKDAATLEEMLNLVGRLESELKAANVKIAALTPKPTQ